MDWEYALGQYGVNGSGTKVAFQVVTATELNAEYTDPTLMATRLVTGVQFSAAAGPNSTCVLGVIAWDDINNTVPPTAELPGPITNGNLDWIIRQVHFNLNGGSIGSHAVGGDETLTSRARRRLGSSRTILCVLETINGAAISGASADVRCLIKE